MGRLAPSPTGLLHLGHARTFLLAYWHARQQRGRLILRMEDLDGPRTNPEFIQLALQDLSWLGLDWDGPPLIQSAGLAQINSQVAALLAQNLAYPCICSRGDIRQAQSAPQLGVTEIRYPGTCRDRFVSLSEAEKISNKPAGIRLRVPDVNITLHDAFLGTSTHHVQAEVGDFLLARRDRAPAYQLAVVVDDACQNVTHVLRGRDLLSSAARQWHVQTALQLAHPVWIHVPLVVDHNGRRLAKREADLSLAELRARGVKPEAIVGWVARHSGFPDLQKACAAELSPHFDLARVPKTDVVLTEQDLLKIAET